MRTKKALIIVVSVLLIALISCLLYIYWDDIFGGEPFLRLDHDVDLVDRNRNETYDITIKLTAEKNLGKVNIFYNTSDLSVKVEDFDNEGYDGETNDILEKNEIVYLTGRVKIPREAYEWIEIKIHFVDVDNVKQEYAHKIFLGEKEVPGFEAFALLIAVFIAVMLLYFHLQRKK